MTDDNKADRSRYDIDDSVLDRYLEALPRFDPTPGFEDLVMSRVLVPPPLWIQAIRRGVVSLVETRRVRRFAAAAALASALSWIVIATVVLSDIQAASGAVHWASTNVVDPIWRSCLEFVSDGVRWGYVLLPLLPTRATAGYFIAATLGFLAFDVAMLAWLMRPRRQGGVE